MTAPCWRSDRTSSWRKAHASSSLSPRAQQRLGRLPARIAIQGHADKAEALKGLRSSVAKHLGHHPRSDDARLLLCGHAASEMLDRRCGRSSLEDNIVDGDRLLVGMGGQQALGDQTTSL